jgi:LPXTG-site transpeptidase (sortase) family protein
LIEKSLSGKFFSGFCLGCGVFLQAALYCSSAISAEAEAVAHQTGLMAKLGLEHFSPDQSQWSDKARAHYETTKDGGGEPLAVLAIDRLNITAPVYKGTSRVTLDRGIGLVEFSPLSGETGNIALSGHRDGFFRPLKDIKFGDKITLHTLAGDQVYLVSDVRIVDALDTSVLDQTDTAVLTLITCHPFYYVGYAPDRYIVRATLVDGGSADITTHSVRSATLAGAGGISAGLNARK